MRYNHEPDYPSQPTNVRSYFDNDGCHIHGHPSCGGILIKHSADLVDLHYLSLPRLAGSERSPNSEEEDTFCERLRRLGASWWKDEADFLRAFHGKDAYDEDRYLRHKRPASMENEAANEKRARRSLTFGWPAAGAGVWITKFKPFAISPQGCSRKMDFALTMEERIQVMQETGAEFIEDVEAVKELNEPWSEDVYDYYAEEEDGGSSSSASEYYEGDSPSCI
jgi:hypothetical protein